MRDLNALPITSEVRKPRCAVKINDVFLPANPEAWAVDNNAFRAADTFTVDIAWTALPPDLDVAWFSQQTNVMIEIFATEDCPTEDYTPAQADSLIYGQVDDVAFDLNSGKLTLSGRDLTAKLIDTKGTVGYLNKTSSQIATILAGQAGLTPVVTATTTQVGTFYNQNHISLTQERSQWDILCELAQFEDFDVFVTGKELHFQPKPDDNGERYVIQYTPPTEDNRSPDVNATAISFGRSLTIAKGVQVIVTSAHAKHGRSYSVTWPKNYKQAAPGTSGTTTPLIYRFNKPTLTYERALLYARRRYDEIIRHMVTLSADMPGDNLLNCSKIVQVRGTGTAWDQDYYPDSVKRSMSLMEGYRMTLTAKNKSDDIEEGTI